MKETKLTAITTEDLLKQKKLLYTVSGTLAGGLIILIIMIVLLVIKSGMTTITIALSVIPIALLPIILSNLSQIKLIKNELESRIR